MKTYDLIFLYLWKILNIYEIHNLNNSTVFSVVSLFAQSDTLVNVAVTDDMGEQLYVVGLKILDKDSVQIEERTVFMDDKGYFTVNRTTCRYIVVSSLGLRPKVIELTPDLKNINISLVSYGSSPAAIYTEGGLSFKSLATFNRGNLGFTLDGFVKFPYWWITGKQESLKDTFYNKIMEHSGIGVKLAKLHLADNRLLPSLYYQFKYNLKFNSWPYYIHPYARLGLYMDVENYAIKSQNLEYGVGVTMRFNNIFGYKHLLRNLSLDFGYQGFNKRSSYNNLYIGVVYHVPTVSVMI